MRACPPRLKGMSRGDNAEYRYGNVAIGELLQQQWINRKCPVLGVKFSVKIHSVCPII